MADSRLLHISWQEYLAFMAGLRSGGPGGLFERIHSSLRFYSGGLRIGNSIQERPGTKHRRTRGKYGRLHRFLNIISFSVLGNAALEQQTSASFYIPLWWLVFWPLCFSFTHSQIEF